MKKFGGGKIVIYICHVKIYTNMMKDLQTKLKSKKAESFISTLSDKINLNMLHAKHSISIITIYRTSVNCARIYIGGSSSSYTDEKISKHSYNPKRGSQNEGIGVSMQLLLIKISHAAAVEKRNE